MKKIKPLKAYCVINKKDRKLNALQIYEDKEIQLSKDEEMIKVEIRACK